MLLKERNLVIMKMQNNNKSSKWSTLAVTTILILALLITAATTPVFADEGKTVSTNNDNSSATSQSDSDDSSLEKQETVYVIASADGSVDKVIVSDWLKNSGSEATVNDETDLNDLEVVKNDASYTVDSNNMHIWTTNGSDVYYKGTSDKALPVDVKLTYKLDGQPISADELAGKSGKVTIRFDYTNKEKETVKVDDKDTEMYVPFVMLSGMMLDNDKFSNIEVTNGKVINEGEKTIVVGMALPGMQEDLGVSEDKFDIPDYIEVTADANEFSLDTTLTVAADNLFADVDSSKITSADDLENALTDLNDATTKLLDGSNELAEGLDTLMSKTGSLVDGISELDTGAGTLDSGIGTLLSKCNTLTEGVNELSTGAYSLDKGLESLNSKTGSLTSGVNLLASGGSQLKDGLNQLNNSTDSLISGASQVQSGLTSLCGDAASGTGLAYASAATSQLSSGIDSALSGAQQIKKYSSQLYSGLVAAEGTTAQPGISQLSSGAAALDTGLKTLDSDTVIGSAQQAAGAIDGYVSTLSAVSSGTSSEIASSASTAENKSDDVTANVNQAESTLSSLKTKYNMSDDDYNALLASLNGVSADASDIEQAAQTIESDASTVSTVEAASQTAAKYKPYADGLNNGLSQIKTNLDTASQYSTQISSGLASLDQNMTNAIIPASKGIDDGLSSLIGDASNKTGLSYASAAAKAISSGITDAYNGAKQILNGCNQLVSGIGTQNDKSNGNQKTLAGAISSLYAGSDSLSTGLTTLQSNSTELVNGVSQLSSGASQLDSGLSTLNNSTSTLVNGVSQLKSGSSELKTGIDTLSSSTGTLVDGVKQLDTGANELNDGMKEFKEKGIDKLTEAFDGDVSTMLSRAKAIFDISDDYKNYSGLSSDMNGNVKFIYKTASIDSDD
jgi:putative membrane protein